MTRPLVRTVLSWFESVAPRVLSFALDLVVIAVFVGLWLVVFTRGAVLSP